MPFQSSRLRTAVAGVFLILAMGAHAAEKGGVARTAAIWVQPSDQTAEAWAAYERGFAFAQKGDLDRALAALKEAIRLDPKEPVFFNDRGVIYARMGDFDLALFDLDEALRLEPDNTKALYNRGLVYERKADLRRAMEDYEMAIRVSADSRVANSHSDDSRGLVLSEHSEIDRLMTELKQTVRLFPRAKVVRNAGSRPRPPRVRATVQPTRAARGSSQAPAKSKDDGCPPPLLVKASN